MSPQSSRPDGRLTGSEICQCLDMKQFCNGISFSPKFVSQAEKLGGNLSYVYM